MPAVFMVKWGQCPSQVRKLHHHRPLRSLKHPSLLFFNGTRPNPWIFALPLWAFQAVRAQTYTTTYQASSLRFSLSRDRQARTSAERATIRPPCARTLYKFAPGLLPFCTPGCQFEFHHREHGAIEVAWCMKSGYGTRIIPDGTITGAHFVKTPDYVQITGVET
ncbi:hypothetical protein BC826DRAFT_658291 [Russula brevipes]|nr:hypothetical protein BC826DRAFT_658291 [Russula brevipes]